MPGESTHSDRQRLLWGMGLGGFLVNADNRAIAPMLPAIALALHVSTASAALLVTAYSIPYGVFQLVYGPIADRIGKIKTILLALILFSVGTILCGIVHTFTWLFALRLLTGMFAAGIIPTTLAQIGDLFTLSERPRAIAFFMSLSTSGQALGIVIGGLLAQFVSYRYLFVIIGFAAIPTLIGLLQHQRRATSRQDVSLPALDEQPLGQILEGHVKPAEWPNDNSLWHRYRLLFSQPRSWLVYTLVLAEGFVFYGGFTFLGAYGVSLLHLSYLEIGLLTATYSLGAFIGSRTISAALSRIDTRHMPIIGAILMTLGFAIMWGLRSPWALTAGFILLGFGFSYCHSTLQTYATDLLPSARGTAVSLFAFSLFTGSGLGPMVAGVIFGDYGWNALLGAVTASMAVFAIFTMLLFRQPLHKEQPATNSSLRA